MMGCRVDRQCCFGTCIHHGANMSDNTEALRRNRLGEINAEAGSREALEARYGQVWDTQQLSQDFEVLGFLAPYVVVRRRSDGLKGSLEFSHHPRLYFSWQPDR